MYSSTFSRRTGLALAAGGTLTILINLVLTPFMLLQGRPLAETATTTLFLWRQSLSALAVASLLIGSVGLYLRQAERAGPFGAVAFAGAFFGSALVLGWEWIDVFIIRDLAQRAPDTLQLFESAKGLHLYDLAAIIPIVAFALGWIALAASTYRSVHALRRGAVLLIAGFFAIPFISAALGPIWGGALGNLVLGSGWILLSGEVGPRLR